MTTRLRLRREDGRVFLDRWGWESKRFGGIFLHKMSAPDPGVDLHDHPWSFASLILWGGYTEERSNIRDAPYASRMVEQSRVMEHRGLVEHRRPWSVKVMRLDECHRIIDLFKGTSWSIIVHGPARRRWGFYLPALDEFHGISWFDALRYEDLQRRTLYTEVHHGGTPQSGVADR